MHSQDPIAHNHLSHHLLHSIPNLYAQGSYNLRNSIRSVQSGMKWNPDFSNEFGCSFCPPKDPATYTLSCRLGAAPKPKCRGVPTGRSLAYGPPAAAGIAACPGAKLFLPPALLSSTCRLPPRRHTHTPQITRLPQSGCSRRVFNTASTRSHNAAEQRFPKRQVLTTINPEEYINHIPI